MDNKTAFGLALVIVGIFIADAIWFGGSLPVFLGKLIADISDWLAVWR